MVWCLSNWTESHCPTSGSPLVDDGGSHKVRVQLGRLPEDRGAWSVVDARPAGKYEFYSDEQDRERRHRREDERAPGGCQEFAPRGNAMQRKVTADLVHYGIALTAIAVTLLARWLLQPALQDNIPYLMFVLPVSLSAWYGGLRPGLFATLLSAFDRRVILRPASTLRIECRSGRCSIHACSSSSAG